MCGIAGAFGASTDASLVNRVSCDLHHRGPDDDGLWSSADRHAVLAHRRLAIVDLSPSGAQPMPSFSGRYITAFNGEIYNYRDIRADLLTRGAPIRGQSDTEVMLAAMEVWGVEETLQRINGMFAVAVYDTATQRMYLFRDRLGVKPLYYQWLGGTLYFSSELTSSFAALGARNLDRTAIALYFRYNYIPAPYTIYEGVRKVRPGHLHVLSLDCAQRGEFAVTKAYWDTVGQVEGWLEQPVLVRRHSEAVELVDAAIARSVAERMVADVPVGAFLSGGVDSSVIVAHMQRQSARPVRTFTIGFSDEERNEAAYARAIASHLGTDHTEFVVTERDAIEVIERLPRMYGEPFADSSQIPTFLVSRLTRGEVTVALSGDGGDELFAGYASYQTLRRAQSWLRFIPPASFAGLAYALGPGWVQKRLQARFGEQRYDWLFNALRLFARDYQDRIPRGLHSRRSLSERMVKGSVAGDSLVPYTRSRGNAVERMMCHDTCVYLPDDILTKVDRASMAVSLEVRAPFVDDWRLLELAWRLPFGSKTDASGGKRVLKDVLARHVPRPLFERPKMGFAIPLGRWLNGPLREWVGDCTEPERIAREGYLDKDEIARLVRLSASGDEWTSYKLWAVCMFQSWLADVHFA